MSDDVIDAGEGVSSSTSPALAAEPTPPEAPELPVAAPVCAAESCREPAVDDGDYCIAHTTRLSRQQ